MTAPQAPHYKGYELIPFCEGGEWGVSVIYPDGRPPVRTVTYMWLSDAFAEARNIVDELK
jgi:hypothetical protein